MAFDELLADRVRACLQHVGGVSERKMFGGLAFMIGGHLTVGVYGARIFELVNLLFDACHFEPTSLRFELS